MDKERVKPQTVSKQSTDRFPDQNIGWMLFTAIDGDEHVVDVGGGLI